MWNPCVRFCIKFPKSLGTYLYFFLIFIFVVQTRIISGHKKKRASKGSCDTEVWTDNVSDNEDKRNCQLTTVLDQFCSRHTYTHVRHQVVIIKASSFTYSHLFWTLSMGAAASMKHIYSDAIEWFQKVKLLLVFT